MWWRKREMIEHYTSGREFRSNFLAFNGLTRIALKSFKLKDVLHPT
jgi:hypothetical protein